MSSWLVPEFYRRATPGGRPGRAAEGSRFAPVAARSRATGVAPLKAVLAGSIIRLRRRLRKSVPPPALHGSKYRTLKNDVIEITPKTYGSHSDIWVPFPRSTKLHIDVSSLKDLKMLEFPEQPCNDFKSLYNGSDLTFFRL
jgi:hypothetical protein